MAAIIADNPRILKNLYHSLPLSESESKFRSSFPNEIRNVLVHVSKTNLSISYVAIDKYSPQFCSMRGNELYRVALHDLLSCSVEVLSRRDVSIYLDYSSSIKITDLVKMSFGIFDNRGKNVRRCVKADSSQNKCIQIVDFVAGAVRVAYEYEDRAYYDIIKEKISVARGFLWPHTAA